MKKLVLVLLSIAAASVAVIANPVSNSTTGAETLALSDKIPFDPSLPFIPGPVEPRGSFDCIDIEVWGNSWNGYYFWIDCNEGAGMSRIELENLNTGEKLNVRVRNMGPTTVRVNRIEGMWKIVVKDLQGVSYYGNFTVDDLTHNVVKF